jgi:hypothetical protein
LRLHTTSTIRAFGPITRAVGTHVRRFRNRVCTKYATRDLPSEDAARHRRQARRLGASLQPSKRKEKAKERKLNLNTYKFHALGHYPPVIPLFGPTDNYSTQIVR